MEECLFANEEIVEKLSKVLNIKELVEIAKKIQQIKDGSKLK
jgi:hypothetical protein